MELITIIIVCYNCGEDIIDVMKDIQKSNYNLSDLQIIIVDNNSQDASLSLFGNFNEVEFSVIKSKENIGFGRGCNLALPMIKGNKTLFLNPDVKLSSDSLKNLFDFSNLYPSSKVWGGQTINLQGENDGQNAWREPSLIGVLSWAFFGDIFLKKLSLRIPDAYTSTEIQKSPYVDSISGCFLLMDTELFKQLEGFDERFFMYSEEVDLCRRARSLGAKPMSTDKAVILHEGSKTITSRNKLNFLYHSKLKYCKKYWSPISYYTARACLFLGSVLRGTLFSLFSFNENKRAEAKIWWEFCSRQLKWKIEK
tara:strand:+ start:1273 stop:2202 length:930 start_codon:yes stop_codon:yes gene_type:complete